jgi:16S rRNA (cytosine967-C5)-methyltransferase
MTPGARVAAAIEILDQIADGQAAEAALTRWARRSRFAGSKDRAAVRDHVFGVLRSYRLAAHYGGAETGRGLMAGLMRAQGLPPETLFTGEGHAPEPLSAQEAGPVTPPEDRGVQWNLPDWLLPGFEESLGQDAGRTAVLLQQRAPVALRVNTRRATREAAMKALEAEGIITVPTSISDTALIVTEGARRVRNSTAFQNGVVELQDAASQAVIETLPYARRLLDLCAGGGGKSLALAADAGRHIFAHDIDPSRMQDIPRRAARAGVEIEILETGALKRNAPFDMVLCDVPCSGSGAWRRAPEGKWTLTPQRFADLNRLQDEILKQAAELTGPGGILAYATCSVLKQENEARIDDFLRQNAGWRCTFSKRFDVCEEADGFFVAHLKRKQS